MKRSGRGYDGYRGEEEPTGRQKWVRSQGKQGRAVLQPEGRQAGREGGPGSVGGGGEIDGFPGQVGIDPVPAGGSPRDSSPSLTPVTSPSSHTARPPPARAYI